MFLQFIAKYPAFGSKGNYHGFKAEYKFITSTISYKSKQNYLNFFNLDYGITTGTQQGIDCTFIYNSTITKSGWFGSPNHPGLYPQNLKCNYYFYGEMEEYIHIRFTHFDVEGIDTYVLFIFNWNFVIWNTNISFSFRCEFQTASDYVEFSNFLSTDRKYRRYCGKLDEFDINSDGRFFRIAFVSNDRFDKTGFRALYDFENKSIPVDITSVQSYVSDCSQKFVISYYSFGIYVFIINTFI